MFHSFGLDNAGLFNSQYLMYILAQIGIFFPYVHKCLLIFVHSTVTFPISL